MVNNLEFSERLKRVMEHYKLTASLFADKITVQRSSISHILSGRNKPSLDFILKVTNTFKDVDIYWLLNGKGIFPMQKNQREEIQTSSPPLVESNQINKEKKIQRIVVFYTDGTFEEYKKTIT